MTDTDSSSLDRRRFLTVLGVSTAGAATLTGCSTGPVEKLVPYLVQSEDQVPGVATWYASTCEECAAGCGLHVRTREGRAVKLEGNPEHPVNRGKLCSRGQAALQGLYNPDRVKGPMARNASGGFDQITWDDAIGRLVAKLGGAAGKVAVISGAGRGTFSDLLSEWVAALGGRVVRYRALDQEPLRPCSVTSRFAIASARWTSEPGGTVYASSALRPARLSRGPKKTCLAARPSLKPWDCANPREFSTGAPQVPRKSAPKVRMYPARPKS